MMPPPAGTVPPDPNDDIAPYPGSALDLGAGRWLLTTGVVSLDPRGMRCELTPQTLKYWEQAAIRGGNVLSELIG